ncbi:hypothetical protein MBLNU13_g06175t1 [Cladosporium sp. NU13]
MGNKLSAPVKEPEQPSPMLRSGMRSITGSIRPRTSDATSLSRHTRTHTPSASRTISRTTPRSIDIVEAASLATLSLRPPTSGNTPPKPLATTLKHRKIGRSALTFFSCGRNVFIHFAGLALLERKIVKAAPGTKALEDAAEQVWIEIAMYDTEQRAMWEDAAREAKAALIGEELTADVLLEAHCVPQYKARYQALAAHAVDELLKRYAAGTWPKHGGTGFAPEVAEAARRASHMTNKSEATESKVDHAIERDIVSAINLRDLPSEHFIGVEPSISRFTFSSSRDIDQSSVRSATPTPAASEAYPHPTFGPSEVVDAAATARLFLDLNMTPPRSNRDSLRSITTSLYTDVDTDVDTEPEIMTMERITPVKAKIVDCKR